MASDDKNEHGDPNIDPAFPITNDSLDNAGGAGYDENQPPLGADSSPSGSYGASRQSTSGDPRGGSKAISRQELGQQENNAAASGASGAISTPERALSDKLSGSMGKNPAGKGYTEEIGGGGGIKQLRSRLGAFTRKRIATAALASMVGGGGILGFSIIQGPFQLIHFAQYLQGSFDQREDEDQARMSKVARYLYHVKKKDGVQNVRLGYFSNKYTNKIEAKMNRAGFETAYKGKFGYRSGYIIDPEKLTGTGLDKYKKTDSKGKLDVEKTNQALKAGLEKDFGVSIGPDKDGKLFANTREIDGKFRKGRAFDKFILKNSGYAGTTTAINSRLIGKRAGLTWHPIKKADRKINLTAEARYNKWQADRKARIKGTTTTPSVKAGHSDDTNATPEENEARKQAVESEVKSGNELTEEAKKAGDGDRGAIEKFQNSTKAKVAGGTAGVIGLVCLIKVVDDGAEEKKEKEVTLRSMKIAGEFLAVGSQGQAGTDNEIEQMGFYAKQLNGVDSSGKRTSWTQSSLVRDKQGKAGGAEPNETLKTIPSGSPFAFINQGVIGAAAGAACSTAGIIATTVVSVVTGGVVAVAAQMAAAFVAAPYIIGELTNWLSGNALDPTPVGAELGNTGHVGSEMIARYQGASGMGRELSNTETAQYESYLKEDSKQEMQSKSIAYRLFNPNDHRTLTAQLIDSNAVSTDSVASFVTGSFGNFGKLFSMPSNWVSPKAQAARPPIVKDVGFSPEELSNSKVENPYANAEDVIKRIGPAHPDYIERAKICGGIEVDPVTYDVVNLNSNSPTFKDAEKSECKDTSEDYLQFRMYLKDSQLFTSVVCYEGDEEACSEITGGPGGGASSSDNSTDEVSSADKVDVSKIGTNSDKVSCADGSDDLGVATTKYTGVYKKESGSLKIRLCQISGIPGQGNNKDGGTTSGGAVVDARLSGVWVSIAKKAKAEGVSLTSSSSFRLADSCGGGGDGTSCARPGQSFHQTGLAIDFAEMGGFNATGSTTSCSGRMTFTSEEYRWMRANSETFGIKQYSAESWHWDPMQTENRCGKNDGP